MGSDTVQFSVFNFQKNVYMTIGVLALQGDFMEHMNSLENHGVLGVEIRTITDLKQVDALILPGGESTTIAKLLKSTTLDSAIRKRIEEGMPVWGTCAGAILLAKNVDSPSPLDTSIGLMDVDIQRNAYGRQTESFQSPLDLPYGRQDVMFIRAPQILRKGRGVQVLAKYRDQEVMLRSQNILITTFHSELSEKNLVLEYFLQSIVTNH